MIKKNIVIFASGAGSNAKALMEFAKKTQKYEVVHVITDQKNAGVITWAKHFNVPISIIPQFSYDTRSSHEERILNLLKEIPFHLIVLAGYQKLLTKKFLSYFPEDSIVNIHPSLLPHYPGQNALKKAWENKDSEIGVTIHYVDAGIDTGKIIKQAKINIDQAITLQELEEKVHSVEHNIYAETISSILGEERFYRVDFIRKRKKNIEDYSSIIIKSHSPLANLYFFSKKYLCDDLIFNVSISTEQTLNLLNSSYELSLVDNFSPTFFEVTYKYGITNNKLNAIWSVLNLIPYFKEQVQEINTLKIYINVNENDDKYIYNEWTENLKKIDARTYFAKSSEVKDYFNRSDRNILYNTGSFDEVPIKDMTLSALEELNIKNYWSLSIDELKAIQVYFSSQKRNPNDVEMEIIAQTWSEHCKHKIFNACIKHTEAGVTSEYHSLFKTFIVGATKKILNENKIEWTRSIFTDNAGIVRWDNHFDICIKVETHNSPSALDPYAGALTGILGVNRDILGTGIGGRPVANTSVFCLPPSHNVIQKNWPNSFIEPTILREGVHRGVKDGGNKTGIPTVNGAFLYHTSYSAKPLVFCGTVGIIPQQIQKIQSHEKNHLPGDLIVMVGGRVGKDGVHGATFSSVENDGTFPSSVVQMGDPMTQKRMTDFILKARDLSLYSSITDNGAGGLSSSVGEMALKTNGAHIEAQNIPLKYLGLTLSEIIISESQERMTCSVTTGKIEAFLSLAKEYNVEASVIGNFNDSGFFTVSYNNKIAVKLALDFLNNGIPNMQLISEWNESAADFIDSHDTSKSFYQDSSLLKFDLDSKIEALLKHPNITSHQKFVQQYDHEVQAASCLKQFSTHNGPTDAAVLKMSSYGSTGENGIVISNGLMNLSTCSDPKLMAYYAVDEALRNALCVGVDLTKIALVDNFCWPNPIATKNDTIAKYKLGALVKTCQGLYEITNQFGLPLISGKDSMKNDSYFFTQQDLTKTKTKVSVTPTLLITLLGHKDNVYNSLTSQLFSGDDIWLLKPHQTLNMVTLGNILGKKIVHDYFPPLSKIFENYRVFSQLYSEGIIKSAHDVSEGGALIALIEMAIYSNLGMDINLSTSEQYFGEGMGMILFCSQKENRSRIKSKLLDAQRIGVVGIDDKINLPQHCLNIATCKKWYKQGAENEC